MFFSQTIRDLFSKISETNKTVNKIDKDSALTAGSQKILVDDFQELKSDFKNHVLDPQDCSSQRDVGFLLKEKVLQNGRIDRLAETVGNLTTAINTSKDRKRWKEEWKADAIKYLLFLMTLIGFMFQYEKWSDSKKQVPTVAVQPPIRTEMPMQLSDVGAGISGPSANLPHP